jgi:S-ribosylhomocysteine lyase
MQKIASFQVDHLHLLPGVYASRQDKFGSGWITTFDLRFKAPNREPVMDMPIMHTLEHLCATFLRNHPQWGKKVVYFGPMGCRTGCYWLVEGLYESEDVLPVVKEMLDWIMAFEDGGIPGAVPADCGNWREHNLNMTKYEVKKYADILKNAGPENLNYP